MPELQGHVPRDQNFVSAAVMYTYDPPSGEYSPFQSNSDSVKGIITGKLSVGVTATQGLNIPCTYVVLMNHTSGAVLYIGGDNTVSSDTGFGALANTDVTQQLNVNNFNLLWLVSDTPATDVRYFIGTPSAIQL